MAANGMTPCQPRKKARTTIQAADLPGRPDRLRRNVTADAPAVTRVGDTTLHPDLARIRLPGHGHGAASGKKIIGHAMTGHIRTGLTGEAPTRGHQGPPTGPGRHGVPVPTTRPAGRAAIAGSSWAVTPAAPRCRARSAGGGSTGPGARGRCGPAAPGSARAPGRRGRGSPGAPARGSHRPPARGGPCRA